MILIYKCDFVSVLGNAEVLNENNEVLFQVKRKLFSITHKAKIYDSHKKLLYVVRRKFFRLFLRSALIYSHRKKIAKVTRKITVKNNYSINGFKQNIHIDGSIVGGNYRIIVDDRCIAEIKTLSAFTEKVLDIPDPEDAGLVVAIYCAIINICNSK